jgi:hypothetical protein
MGVWLYGEHVTAGPLRLAGAVATFVAMITGVVMLARTAPSFAADRA